MMQQATDSMDLTFEIIAHREDAMFDDFADGASQSYDVATIRVLSGPLSGRTFHVCIPTGAPESGLWRQTGRRRAAEVRPEDIEGQDILYSGAFTLKETGP